MDYKPIYCTGPYIADVETREGDIFEPGEKLYYKGTPADGYLTREVPTYGVETYFIVLCRTNNNVTRVKAIDAFDYKNISFKVDDDYYSDEIT